MFFIDTPVWHGSSHLFPDESGTDGTRNKYAAFLLRLFYALHPVTKNNQWPTTRKCRYDFCDTSSKRETAKILLRCLGLPEAKLEGLESSPQTPEHPLRKQTYRPPPLPDFVVQTAVACVQLSTFPAARLLPDNPILEELSSFVLYYSICRLSVAVSPRGWRPVNTASIKRWCCFFLVPAVKRMNILTYGLKKVEYVFLCV